MPTLHLPPSLDLHYRVDDYTDPWRTPGTILLLHGNAESGAAWYAWVPRLAQRYRVVRPDLRGFGASTPMPREFPWTLDVLIDDAVASWMRWASSASIWSGPRSVAPSRGPSPPADPRACAH